MEKGETAPVAEPESAVTAHHLTCPLCEATCGLTVHVQDGEIQTIHGDKDDPLSGGYMCPKGYGLKGLHADPDRIKTPMIRIGDRWAEVSWNEAFTYIRSRMATIRSQSGNDALAVYLGNPNVHNLDAQIYLSAVMRAAGTKNRFSASTLDQLPKQLVAAFMYGSPMSIPIPDVDRCMYFLVLGANPLVSNGSMMTAPNMRDRLRAMQARGGKVVVVDPVRTRTAKAADVYHPIRPSTDAWFLLAILHTLFAESLVHLRHLREHVQSLDEIERVAGLVTPEAAQSACGIAADAIRTIARELAAADGAAIYGRMGTCTQRFGGLTTWLIDVLNVVTGNLDRPGGVMFPLAAATSQNVGKSRARSGFRIGRFQSRVRGLPEVLGELPTAAMVEEMEVVGEGQVRALLTIAGNPIISTPDSERLTRAIERLDLMVAVDFYLNETTRHAHVFLPVPSPLERDHYDLTFTQLSIRNVAHFSEALFELPPGQLHEWEVLLHLAAALRDEPFSADAAAAMDDGMMKAAIDKGLSGIDEAKRAAMADVIFQQLGDERGPQRFLDLLLRTGPYGDGFGTNPGGISLRKVKDALHGLDLGPLKPRLPGVLATPSGQVELAPKLFADDLDRLLQSTAALDNSEFLLVGRRILQSNNSWMHNIQELSKGIVDPPLWMNPSDALPLGVQSGSGVRVSSAASFIETAVLVTEDVMPGVVSLPHGFGHIDAHARLHVAAQYPGVNYNRLSSTELLDEATGNAAFNGIPVSIAKL